MRDLFGREVTMEEALQLKSQHPRRPSRAQAVIGRMMAWRHPHTGLPLLDPLGETCGTCKHSERSRSRGGGKTWIKCGLFGASGGPATDIKARWPACERWQADHTTTITTRKP
jgi:hypothetical protein